MMKVTEEMERFFPKVLEDLAQLIFEELDLGLSNLSMTERVREINCFLDYLHGVYIIQCVSCKGL
jgi:hypothetical protein